VSDQDPPPQDPPYGETLFPDGQIPQTPEELWEKYPNPSKEQLFAVLQKYNREKAALSTGKAPFIRVPPPPESMGFMDSLVRFAEEVDPRLIDDTQAWRAPVIVDQIGLYEASLRPPDWIVEGLYTRGCRGLIAAEGKAGKTFLVCFIGLCVAAGVPVFGGPKVNEPGPVMFVTGEDELDEMGRRLRRMAWAMNQDLRSVPVRYADAREVRLDRTRDVTFWTNYIRDEGIRMIFFDPIARLMDGDENDKQAVARILNPLGDIASETGCIVQIVHHMNKPARDVQLSLLERIRGSTDFQSWFVTALLFEGRVRDGRVRCELHQRISGKLPGAFTIDVVENEVEALGDMTSMRLVANFEDAQAASMTREQQLEKCVDDLIEFIELQPGRWATKSQLKVVTGYSIDMIQAAVVKLVADRGVGQIIQCPARTFESSAVQLIGARATVSIARQDQRANEAFDGPGMPDEPPAQGDLFVPVDSAYEPPGDIADDDVGEPWEPPPDDLAF